MTQETHSFRRVVLGLQARRADHAVTLGVELATCLRVELLGLFFEDTDLVQLANIPFARELRPLGGGWKPIEFRTLSRDLELAAERAERLFIKAAKPPLLRSRFEVVRGATAKVVTAISQVDDILIIAEPASGAERATQQFSSLIDAALQSRASVMLVPPRPMRSAGPVLAIAVTPDDPSIDAAKAIAMTDGHGLIVVTPSGNQFEERLREMAADGVLAVKHIVVDVRALADPAALSHALENTGDRLTVVRRGTITDHAARSIASLRRIPVLVVEPAHSRSPLAGAAP